MLLIIVSPNKRYPFPFIYRSGWHAVDSYAWLFAIYTNCGWHITQCQEKNKISRIWLFHGNTISAHCRNDAYIGSNASIYLIGTTTNGYHLFISNLKHLNVFFQKKNLWRTETRKVEHSELRKENFKNPSCTFPVSVERQLLFVCALVDNMNSVHDFCRDKEKPRLLILSDGRAFIDLFWSCNRKHTRTEGS